MKAMVVHPAGGRVPPTLQGGRRDVEAQEVAAYLSKLRSLLPLSPPKKRKISKLELIQRVIDYICDLQTTLEESTQQQQSDQQQQLDDQQQQQPTVIVQQQQQQPQISAANTCGMQQQLRNLVMDHHHQHHHHSHHLNHLHRKPLQPLNTEIAMEER